MLLAFSLGMLAEDVVLYTHKHFIVGGRDLFPSPGFLTGVYETIAGVGAFQKSAGHSHEKSILICAVLFKLSCIQTN